MTKINLPAALNDIFEIEPFKSYVLNYLNGKGFSPVELENNQEKLSAIKDFFEKNKILTEIEFVQAICANDLELLEKRSS